MERLRVTGGRVLLRSDGEQAVDVSLEDGRIAGIGSDGGAAQLDARGLRSAADEAACEQPDAARAGRVRRARADHDGTNNVQE